MLKLFSLQYKNTFIGIALPDKFQSTYEQLLQEITNLDCGVRTINPHTPHITLFFLGNQTLEELSRISKLTSPLITDLYGEQVKICKHGFFDQDIPHALFIRVEVSKLVYEIYFILKEKLKKYYFPDFSSFYPHLTIGYVNDQLKFAKNKEKIESLVDNVKFDFELKEVFIYGKTDQQQKLINLFHGG